MISNEIREKYLRACKNEDRLFDTKELVGLLEKAVNNDEMDFWEALSIVATAKKLNSGNTKPSIENTKSSNDFKKEVYKDSVFVLYSDEKEKSKTYNITPERLQDIVINMNISDIGYTLDLSGAGNEIAFGLADEVDTKTFNKVFKELVKRIDNAI